MNFGDDKQFMYGTAPGMPMYTESNLYGISSVLTKDLSETQVLKTGIDLQQYTLDDWWPPSGGGMMSPGTFANINNGQRDRY
jgi:iron complex outermembrane receptor protein